MPLGDEVRRVGAAGDTLPVVGDGQTQTVGILREADGDLGRISVLDGVVQRFLRDAIDG